MLSKLSRFLTIATLTTLTCVITHPANSQTTETTGMTPTTSNLNVSELINQAYWQNGGTFFNESKPRGVLNTMFGWRSFPQGSFPENQITKDGLLIYTIVTDYYKQLQEKDPTIRTRDLANPFDTSLREMPLTVTAEPIPTRRIVERQYEPMPVSEPVRGLW